MSQMGTSRNRDDNEDENMRDAAESGNEEPGSNSHDRVHEDNDDEGVGGRGSEGDSDDLDEKYPNRPRNSKETLPFHVLYDSLFHRLSENIKKKTGPHVAFKKQAKPHDVRRQIIERFIARWRHEVGDDIYPAFRLIMPDKDRDRTVYGLKEKALGSILVKVLGISKNSDDAHNLIQWKVPKASGGVAGDFPSKCYEAIAKRPMRSSPGSMTVEQVNDLLDELAKKQKEQHQLPIIRRFYENMNAEEMQWIIRIILKQMRVGATEKTFFDCWHPDAYNLFNVSSQLKRVCWELYDPNFRLDADIGVTLMQCFQPQLAQFQQSSFDNIIRKMRPEDDDKIFWIEEKLDGERMQLHMDNGEFKFWSRKAKDYTYLYGQTFDDPDSSLTKHLKNVFKDGVESCILDGEMITWNPKQDAMVPFGTLKTAALDQQRRDDPSGNRPLFRVFDILYLNGESLINYTLRDRKKALLRAIQSEHRRLEIHEYKEATTEEDINKELVRVIAEASEGLVVKNPRSAYRLGDRNDDWIKVKPDYMVGHGESLDCLVVGAYWGSGRRGGRLSSFLCGLKVDGIFFESGDEEKFWSFFKVGGGFSAADYAKVDRLTDGKWQDWNSSNPPDKYIELGGGQAFFERPDVWIKPQDSFVVSVKAASIAGTTTFRANYTLRFPRFKEIREDRSWESAMSMTQFLSVKDDFNQKAKTDGFKVEIKRNRQKRNKQELIIAGAADHGSELTEYKGGKSNIFEGMKFFIVTDSVNPRKSRSELEQMVKAHMGQVFQSETAQEDIICVGDKNTIRVATLKKKDFDIFRPIWIFDCIANNLLLPYESGRHIFHGSSTPAFEIQDTLDKYCDSYIRDVSVEELEEILKVKHVEEEVDRLAHWEDVVERFQNQSLDSDRLATWMFKRCVVYFDTFDLAKRNNFFSDLYTTIDHRSQVSDSRLKVASNTIRFASGCVCEDFKDRAITHVVVSHDRSRLKAIREKLSQRSPLPVIVTVDWVENSFDEGTMLDVERFPAPK